MNQSTSRNILLVPNEDGFGPSALTSYIANAFLANPNNHVTIWNESRRAYNRSLFADVIKKGHLDVLAVWGLIQLDKRAGEVSIPGTLQKIGEYRSQSNLYPFNPPRLEFDLVLDFGVPAAAKWAAKRGLKSITVFDHSWSKTCQMILAEEDTRQPGVPRSSDSCRTAWHSLIAEIRKDEAQVEHLFLFPRFISPDLFYEHWRSILPESSIHEMTYVLGGNVGAEEAKKNLVDTVGHLPAEDTKAILIQAGDTPVWDSLLPRLAQTFLDSQDELRRRQLLMVIYVPARLRTNKVLAETLGNSPPERVRGFGYLRGGTIQKILPAFDLLITRAGGGSVNDAVACRVPLVCVEESSQPQVEAILKACKEKNLTRRIPWQVFEDDPKGVILAEYGRKTENDRIRSGMGRIERQGEDRLLNEIDAVA